MEIKIKKNKKDSGLFEKYIKYNLSNAYVKAGTMSEQQVKNYLFNQVIKNDMKLVED